MLSAAASMSNSAATLMRRTGLGRPSPCHRRIERPSFRSIFGRVARQWGRQIGSRFLLSLPPTRSSVEVDLSSSAQPDLS